MTSRTNRILVYLLAAVLGVMAVRAVQHLRGAPDGTTPPATNTASAPEDDTEDDNPFPENVPAHDAYDGFMEKLSADPKFKALLAADTTAGKSDKAPDDGYERGFGLAQNGLPRLSDALLEKRLALMSKLVDGMPDADCQALSRPTVASADRQRMLDAAIGRFDEADATAWFDVSLAAAQAVLADTPVVEADRARVTAALEKVLLQLPEADRRGFLDATRAPASATPAQTCQAMRTMYRASMRLEAPYRAAIARGLVTSIG